MKSIVHELVEAEPVAEMLSNQQETMTVLALQTGVGRDTLYRIRNRKRKYVTFDVADKIALVLGKFPPDPLDRRKIRC